MYLSVFYIALQRVLQCVVVACPSREFKELEIVEICHGPSRFKLPHSSNTGDLGMRLRLANCRIQDPPGGCTAESPAG